MGSTPFSHGESGSKLLSTSADVEALSTLFLEQQETAVCRDSLCWCLCVSTLQVVHLAQAQVSAEPQLYS